MASKAEQFLTMMSDDVDEEYGRSVDPSTIRRASVKLRMAVQHHMNPMRDMSVPGGPVVLMGSVDGQEMRVTIEPNFRRY